MQTYFVPFRCAQYTIQRHFITNSNDFNFLSIITLNSRQKTEKSFLPFDTLRTFSSTKIIKNHKTYNKDRYF